MYLKSLKKFAFGFIILISTINSCTKTEKYNNIEAIIDKILEKENTNLCIELLSFKNIFKFNWEECYIFLPNSNIDYMSKVSKITNKNIFITTPDDTYNIIFIKDYKVVYTTQLSTNVFTVIGTNSCIKVDDALFYVDKDNGNYYLHLKNDSSQSIILEGLLKKGYYPCK